MTGDYQTDDCIYFRAVPAIQHFEFEGFRLAYRVYGEGPAMLAFHGYGNTGRSFEGFMPGMEKYFTIYAVDIFFHGESKFPKGRTAEEPMLPEEFKAIIAAFLKDRDIEKTWVMGFSLGGRMAMSVLEQLPERCLGALLFVPDGLVRNPWYRYLSRFGIGRGLYRRFVEKPGQFYNVMRGLNKVKIIGNNRRTFIEYYTQNDEARKFVYDVWLSLRKIEPKLRRVGRNLQDHDLHAWVYLGKYDRVILAKWGKKLKRVASEHVHVEVLEAGHQIMKPELGVRAARLALRKANTQQQARPTRSDRIGDAGG